MENRRALENLPNTRPAAVVTDRVIRSIGSIGANIAEGFNRSQKKYLSSLDIAVGKAPRRRTGSTRLGMPISSIATPLPPASASRLRSRKCSTA